MHRFYAPGLGEADETIALDEEEASHLVRVLRLAAGDEVRVFNGRGLERLARVELADRRGAILRLGAPAAGAPELPFPVTIAQALLKGDKMDDVVRDAVMLGVAAVRPLLTRHTDVPLAHVHRGHRVERWRRIAISSAKQCGRSVVPPVHEPDTLDTVLAAEPAALRVVLVEPGVRASVLRVAELPVPTSSGAVVCIGPEGGWSVEEIARAAAAGARLVQLGGRTLRADAVAVVTLPVLLYAWGAG